MNECSVCVVAVRESNISTTSSGIDVQVCHTYIHSSRKRVKQSKKP